MEFKRHKRDISDYTHEVSSTLLPKQDLNNNLMPTPTGILPGKSKLPMLMGPQPVETELWATECERKGVLP